MLRVSWATKIERSTQWLKHLSERKSLLSTCLKTYLTISHSAGGAYFEPPRGQIYEISEVELKKAGWKESVLTLGSYQERPEHERKESDGSIEGSDAPSPLELAPGGGVLTVPGASASSNRRSGRSPLARVSLIRTASNEEIELEDQQARQHSTERRTGGSR